MRRRMRSVLCLGAVLALAAGPAALADDVHNDDVVIEGHLCVSEAKACANGEDFDIFDMKIKSSDPNLLFQDTGGFDVFLHGEDGKLGVGTVSPEASLEVAGFDGSTSLQVSETSSTTAKRFLLRLENNGPPGFAIRDTESGEEWRYAMNKNDGFVVSREGTGGAEMLIAKNGAMFLGQPAVFRLAANGNLEIAGTLTENSDRAIKRDIAPVDPHRLLERLRGLPISTWAYRHTPKAAHLGPMAQDFHRIFGLGDDPTKVSPRDMAAVAMSAAQALDERVRDLQAEAGAKDAQIAELEAEVDDLRARLARLEEAVER